MKHYNLYTGSQRLNNKPINQQTLDSIIANNIPISKIQPDGSIKQIPLSNIRIVKCTVI